MVVVKNGRNDLIIVQKIEGGNVEVSDKSCVDGLTRKLLSHRGQ